MIDMVERMLNKQIIEQVRQVFDQLTHPVQVLLFASQSKCDYCAETQQLFQEVTEISPKLGLTVYDLDKDAAIARQYHVSDAPVAVLAGKDGDKLVDFGVRIMGIPAGHEFSSLIHDLLLVSGRDSQLSKPTREFLAGLKEPVHLQVFVTPT